MARKPKTGRFLEVKRGKSRFIRRNLTIPANYEPRVERLLQVTGAASFSELVRRSLDELERRYRLPPMPAILEGQKKKKESGK